MIRHAFTTVVVAMVASLTVAHPFAHHSLQAEFDEKKAVTLTGVVSRIEWVNPHVYLYVDVTDKAGKMSTWSVETFPPGTLRRGGLTKEKLGIGQHVTMLAFAARNGKQLAFLRKITFDDGRELIIWLGDIEKASRQ